MSKTPYFFYVPDRAALRELPDKASDFFPWAVEQIKTAPMRNGAGVPIWFIGPYIWTIGTYLFLRDAGHNVALVGEIPSKGIVLAHTDLWKRSHRATRDQLFVEIKPDRWPRIRGADFLVVQSPADPAFDGPYGRSGSIAFAKHWPQGGIIPRNQARGAEIRNACFLGNPENFLPEADIARLEQELAKLGVQFHFRRMEQWASYDDVDVIVAVRPPVYFKRHWLKRFRKPKITMKPALKLTNAWLGGVPAILTPEPAFEHLRRSPLDFIAASSVEEIVSAVSMLKQKPDLYLAMIENARQRAPEFDEAHVTKAWIELLDGKISTAYAQKLAGKRR